MSPGIDAKGRYEKSRVDQAHYEEQLQAHKPERDIHGEAFCLQCASAAPCDEALKMMKRIQGCRHVRIMIHARGGF